jgi:hypothetical protein
LNEGSVLAWAALANPAASNARGKKATEGLKDILVLLMIQNLIKPMQPFRPMAAPGIRRVMHWREQPWEFALFVR